MCLCDCAKDRWLVFKWSLVLVLIKRYDVKKLSPLAEHYSNCLTLHYTRNCKKPFCKIKLILSMQPFCQKRLFISLILALICSIHMERIIIWFMKMRQTRTKKEETVLMFLRFLPMLPVRVNAVLQCEIQKGSIDNVDSTLILTSSIRMEGGHYETDETY